MRLEERERHEEEAADYLRNCTDAQVQGVYDAEKARLSRCSEGDVAEVALIMKRAAIAEANRRDIWLIR